jgi:hypothetical protein
MSGRDGGLLILGTVRNPPTWYVPGRTCAEDLREYRKLSFPCLPGLAPCALTKRKPVHGIASPGETGGERVATCATLVTTRWP